MSINRESSSFYKRGNIQKTYSSFGFVESEDLLSDNSHETIHLNKSICDEVFDVKDYYGFPWYRAVFIIANGAIGAGLLNFPEAFKKCGSIVQALLLQGILAVFIYGAFPILAFCCNIGKTNTYETTVLVFCGSYVQTIVQLLVPITTFGANVTYLIVIGDQLTKVLDFPGLFTNRTFIIIAVAIICILPLCIPKRLRIISYTSLFGGSGALLIALVIVQRYSVGKYTFKSAQTPQKWTDSLEAIPVFCFAFQCHLPSIAVFSELRRPTVVRCSFVTLLAMILCFVIYSLAGAFGYLTFGQNVDSDILVNYDSDDKLVTVARVVIVVVLLTTFSISHFVGRSAVIGLWVKVRRLRSVDIEKRRERRRIIACLLWFALAIALALVIPSIREGIAFVGSINAHFIFTFPGLCLVHVVINYKTSISSSKMKSFAVLLIGIFYVVLGVVVFSQSMCIAIQNHVNLQK
ncbi:putative sodium-coupled neutral amino acid transporter 7 [Xenia sp. Carnegie-2017]|uniref:putative sodium-coupled neutral amino acid transporter 7 n=1 Tax=Xenia sp. Carnegie-2017 TaxID=2897299 RepID=UPI001F0456BD|nr:putative sodium-coupled neutral amino acid transporter 7 [Xenia sp. Carnegie-2017]